MNNLASPRNCIRMGILLTLAAAVCSSEVEAQTLPIDLGAASGFAVLAGSGITNTGTTIINGDVGSFPTPSITGFGTVTLNGTNQAGNPATQNAQTALSAAYANAAGLTPTTSYDPIFDLGGLTLTSGVYHDPSSFAITGTLTLDAQNNPDAVWVFQAGSTLATAEASSIVLINGAQASNVFWQVGSSATLGSDTNFEGTILALTSITMNNGATDTGGVFAQTGAVTLNTNFIIAAPEPSTYALFGLAGAFFLAMGSRRRIIA